MRDISTFITEAWGNKMREKDYVKTLDELFDKVEKRVKKKEEQSQKGKNARHMMSFNPYEVLSKYPMAIIIDKLNYTPKQLDKHTWKRKKDGSYETITRKVTDNKAYAAWLWHEVQAGNIKKEDLITWWKEYDDEISKNHWFDVNYVMKQVDPTRVWDIYYPDSEYVFDRVVKEPGTIFNYTLPDLRLWRLSQEEREQVAAYYSDPTNKEMLSKEFSKLKKMMTKHKPTLKSSVEKWVEVVLRDAKIDGDSYDFDRYFEEKHQPKRYYSGTNDEDCYGDAYYSLIMGAIKSIYKFDFYGGLEYLGDGQYGEKAKYSAKGYEGDDNSELFKKFAEDAESLEIEITDLGSSEKSGDTSGVWSSSFTTFYRHDFKVVAKIRKDGETKEIYNTTAKNIVIGSSYYSGGWN